MLHERMKIFLWNNRYAIFVMLWMFFCATDASAAETFGSLAEAGNKIFTGLRQIIFPAATIGVACVCIAGMFGSFNWKWFVAILIGVFVIAYAEGVRDIATGPDLNGNN